MVVEQASVGSKHKEHELGVFEDGIVVGIPFSGYTHPIESDEARYQRERLFFWRGGLDSG